MLISEKYKKLNIELHRSNEVFGNGGGKWVSMIEQLARKTNSKSILDYGCGKGKLIKALRKKGFEVQGYDPAVKEWDNYPIHKVDMIVCCDVLEHVEEGFVDATLDELRGLSRKAFFAVIALTPSNKVFSNGDNAHITLLSAEEWMERLLKRFVKGKRLPWKNPNKLLFEWSKR